MWILVAVLGFLAAQVYLFHCLKGLDGLMARQQEPEEKQILSLAFSDPDTAQRLTGLLEAFSRENPEVDIVLHTDPSVPDAVYEGRAAIGVLPEGTGSFRDLESCTARLSGTVVQQVVWKAGARTACAEAFLQYLAQSSGNSEEAVV